MEEGGDIVHNVWGDVWFRIVNIVWVAAKDVLEDMSNELPVDVDRGILVFGGVRCCFVLLKIGCYCCWWVLAVQ